MTKNYPCYVLYTPADEEKVETGDLNGPYTLTVAEVRSQALVTLISAGLLSEGEVKIIDGDCNTIKVITKTEAQNGCQDGQPPSKYHQAENRVHNSARLNPYADFILADWPEADEHWDWVISADEEDILNWVVAGQ